MTCYNTKFGQNSPFAWFKMIKSGSLKSNHFFSIYEQVWSKSTKIVKEEWCKAQIGDHENWITVSNQSIHVKIDKPLVLYMYIIDTLNNVAYIMVKS